MCILNWFKNLFNPVKRISEDEKILEAAALLPSHIIDRILDRGAVIRWDSSLDSNIFACRAQDIFGNNFILINYKYHSAPVEQIACLIGHESCHVLEKTTLSEEVEAVMMEMALWRTLKKADVSYDNTALYRRLNKLSKMPYAEVKSYVAESDFYKNILKV